jgi:hypothetical protein
MGLRFFRSSTVVVRDTTDIRRAAWRVIYRWAMPRVEISIPGFTLIEAQRAQVRLRRLQEALERKTGALLAIAVLMIGLADMVRAWNRDLEHMGLVVVAAFAAGFAGRILGRTWFRAWVLFELLRLRWKVGRWLAGGATDAAPAAAPESPQAAPPVAAFSDPSSSLLPARHALQGSCSCGAISFTLSSPPSIMGTCHCTRCRKAGAGTFVVVKRSAFRLVAGADAIATWKSDGPHVCDRSFCARCGTALGEFTSASATFRLAASCFDDELTVSNGFHEFVAEKPRWQVICDEARQFATQPQA